jgi:hypothetical protein
MAVLLAVTAVPLYHSAMDTCTDCTVFVQGRGNFSFKPAVTAVLLHHICIDT